MWIRQLQSLKIAGASVPAHLGACPPGHRIDRDRCFECFPGSYTSGQDSSCFLCPKNFFMPKFAADSCWPCPDGRKTLKYGSDSEDQCILLDSSGNKLLDTAHWIIIGVSILSFFIVLM